MDNTFATPLNEQPLGLGATVSLQSATKFIGGHSDLLAGVATTKDDALWRALRKSRELTGATPGMLEAFLAVRGARTLALRLQRAQQTAMMLAERLESHPLVTRVRYPGLPSHSTHAVAKRVLKGFGTIVSFEVSGGAELADAVCRNVSLIRHATSLGAVESTMERRAAIHGQEHLPPSLLRLSVGIEDADDLWTDLDSAMRSAARLRCRTGGSIPRFFWTWTATHTKTDFAMKRITRQMVKAGLLFLLTIHVVGAGVDSVANEPLDLVANGYVFLAGATAGVNPLETQWLTNGAPGVLAGVMWEEHRPVRRIEVEFAGQAPEASQLCLEVTTSTPTEKQDNRPTWWTRAFEEFPGSGKRATGGRRIVYETSRDAIIRRLDQYKEGFRYEADPQGMLFVDKVRVRYLGAGEPPRVVALHAFGITGLVPMRLAVEWGFQSGPQVDRLEGHIEAYNGRLGTLKPMPGSRGCVILGPEAWRAETVGGSLRGIEAEVFYTPDDKQEVGFRPSVDLPVGSSGRLAYHPNRTVVTLRTTAGSFSLSPRDLEGGEPILLPSLGFLVYKAGNRTSAMDYIRQLGATQHKTIRQRVRSMPEQSLTRALADQYGTSRPPFPQPQSVPSMTIEVPDELATAAWRVAYWHVQRRCLKEDGIYQFYIWPYKALLGQESWRMLYALDLLGEHAITDSGFEPWFRSQGQRVARGMFSDREGALNVSGWDLNHGQGHGSMLFAMAQHYLLTGDKAWLNEHRTNFVAACEWIERQRGQWTEKVGQDSWSAGLVPPCEMGDYADWRSLYQTSLFFWRGLRTAAEALRDVDPDTGNRFLRQAEDFRGSILRAVDRSITQSPVIRVSDGTYRRYIPPQPYLRGMCDQITNPFGGAHAGSLVMDGDLGATALGLGVLPGNDARLDETLDVLEDVVYHDNWMVRKHTRERMPEQAESWFTVGGYNYQCGYSQSALAHLYRDDVPNFLRSTFNQYAADVDPEKGYQFREHPNRTGEGNGGDKTFEAAAFLERMRDLFVMEDNESLWLARATPRTWLQQGKRIAVHNAPTKFGTVSYEIVSNTQSNTIAVTVELPVRRAPKSLLLRLRHPQAAPLRSVLVNRAPWNQFDKERETIHLEGLKGRVSLQATY